MEVFLQQFGRNFTSLELSQKASQSVEAKKRKMISTEVAKLNQASICRRRDSRSLHIATLNKLGLKFHRQSQFVCNIYALNV